MEYPTPAELRELSAVDRLRLIEDVWATFVNSPESLPLGEHHERIIDSRLEDWQRDPNTGSSWEDVRRRITNR